jgi:hypothetical protein
MTLDDEFMKNDNWNPYQEMQRMQNEMEHALYPTNQKTPY